MYYYLICKFLQKAGTYRQEYIVEAWDISEDYRFNEKQHCNGKKCLYSHSHTAMWCGEKQNHFCECTYCYADGLASQVNEQMQLPIADVHDENFTDDIADHVDFYEYQHCTSKNCNYGSNHTYHSCKSLQDHFCEGAYCYEDGVAAHLNKLYEQYLFKKILSFMDFDTFRPKG